MSEAAIAPGATVMWRGDDVPLEVLDAAGCRLLRLDADPAAPGPAADHLGEGGGHPLVRALAAEILGRARGVVPVLGARPVANAALFRLFQSLPENPDGGPHLVQLSHMPSDAARHFNRAAVARLAASCQAQPPALRAAIVRRNAVRRSFAEIEAMRAAHPPRLSGADALELGGHYGTAAETDIERDLRARAGSGQLAGVRVLLIGSMQTAAFYRALEQHGFHVAGEAVEFGLPSAPSHVSETGDPLDALAAAYGAPVLCVRDWKNAVLSRAAGLGAQAVIFALPAYDHATAWIVPVLRAALSAAGVRGLVAPADCFRDPQGAADAILAEWRAS